MEYTRTTSEAKFEELEERLSNEILLHAEKYELGEISSDILMCCVTTSSRKKKSLFGQKTETIVTGIVLTKKYLIWATAMNDQRPAVLSARLSDIHVQDYERSDVYRLIKDSGVNILGLRTDTPQAGSAFIGLGEEDTALKFRELLRKMTDQQA